MSEFLSKLVAITTKRGEPDSVDGFLGRNNKKKIKDFIASSNGQPLFQVDGLFLDKRISTADSILVLIAETLTLTTAHEDHLQWMKNVNGILAAIVIASNGHSASKGSPLHQTNRAARSILVEHLSRMQNEFVAPLNEKAVTDPILQALLKSRTGFSSPPQSVREAASRALNVKFTGKAVNDRKILFEAATTMRALARDERTEMAAQAKQLALVLPRRWIPIVDAFDDYQKSHRVSIEQFKELLVNAADQGWLDLAPVDMPSLYDSNDLSRSETVYGGLAFHLVRQHTK